MNRLGQNIITHNDLPNLVNDSVSLTENKYLITFFVSELSHSVWSMGFPESRQKTFTGFLG
jgi:hypothetical protein